MLLLVWLSHVSIVLWVIKPFSNLLCFLAYLSWLLSIGWSKVSLNRIFSHLVLIYFRKLGLLLFMSWKLPSLIQTNSHPRVERNRPAVLKFNQLSNLRGVFVKQFTKRNSIILLYFRSIILKKSITFMSDQRSCANPITSFILRMPSFRKGRGVEVWVLCILILELLDHFLILPFPF